MNDDQLLRYSRHILLQDFDIDGQQSLLEATALIVGAGGLGCPAAMYLASSGVGHIIIADDDVVEVSNLQRQIGHTTANVGRNKVESLKMALQALNPDVKVTALAQRLTSVDMQQWVDRVDVVLDCSDNFTTRFSLNACCVESRKPLVSGAAVRVEAQLAVFDTRQVDSPCYRCLYSDESEVVENCSDNGVLAPLVGIVGSMQALEAIRLLSGFGDSTVGRLLIADLKQGGWRQLTLKRDDSCPVCSTRDK